MTTKHLMTFVQNSKGLFDVDLAASDLTCLTKLFVFPAILRFSNGNVMKVWVEHDYKYDQEEYAMVHSFRSTTLRFKLKVNGDGRLEGLSFSKSEQAEVWLLNDWSAFYIDRLGDRQYVDVFDEEGEDLPSDPGTCVSCKYEFRVTNEFSNGYCPACYSYEKGEKEMPDLETPNTQWRVYEKTEAS